MELQERNSGKTIYVHNKYDRCKIEPAVAMAIFW